VRRALLLAAAATLGTGSGAALAQAGTAAAAWGFELTPYLWAASMKGNVQIPQLPALRVDVGFGDILDHLDAGFMGSFEARKGSWGLLVDSIYMKLGDGGSASRTGPGPIGAAASASANLEVKETMLGAGAAYRFSGGATTLDAVGGLRAMKIEADVRADASLFAQSGSLTASGSKGWIDPYVGLRVRQPLGDRWMLVGYADVGGFGVGSDFTWQALLGADYEFSKTFVGKAGYRYIAVDYDKGGFVYDMGNTGLYFGLGVRW
jgi:hypothetical protein